MVVILLMVFAGAIGAGVLVFLLAQPQAPTSACDSVAVKCVNGPADPYTTIQSAVNAAVPGDTVLIYRHPTGVYVLPAASGQITITKTNIIVKGVDRDTVVIDARNLPYDNNSSGNAIMVDGWNAGAGDRVTVESLTIINAQRSGVRVSLADNVIVRNLKILNSVRFGIFSDYAESIVVENNYVDGTTIEDLIYLSNSADYSIVRGNTLTNSAEAGIQLNGDCYSNQSRYTGVLDGEMEDSLITDNVLYGNELKGLSIISAPRTRIENNVIYDNGEPAGGPGGIHLTGSPGCNKPSTASVVVNNTIVEPRIAGIRITDGVRDCVIFNNIVAGLGGNTIVDEVGGNHIDGPSNHRLTTVTGYFVSYTNNGNSLDDNLHLLESSPAVNSNGIQTYQSASAPAVDFDDTSRANPYDIGADEYASSGGAKRQPIQQAP